MDDNVREALARVIEAAWGDPTWDGETLRPVDRKIADAILDAFEVRQHGTVTDAEARFVRAFIAQAGYLVPPHVVIDAFEAVREAE